MPTEGKAALIGVVLTATLFSGCDPCRKLAKSKVLAEKDSAAFCYYQRKQYESASLLLEELLGMYRGTARMETVTFYYAMAKYANGDYITSAHYFNEFNQQFPASKYAEESAYMSAQSYGMQSSAVSLDQSETTKAIERFQLFTQLYPHGERVSKANEQIQKLRDKLAQKAFQQATLYYNIGRHHAAIVAFKNVVAEYPDSPFREAAQYKLFLSAYFYAHNSIEEKQEARFLEAVNLYNRYIDKFPNGKFNREAESYFVKIRTELDVIENHKKEKAAKSH